MEWLLPIQDEDVGFWVVEPNDDKMRKHSDMMQVDVVHCCQVEKEVAILEIEEEVCIAQLAVDESIWDSPQKDYSPYFFLKKGLVEVNSMLDCDAMDRHLHKRL